MLTRRELLQMSAAAGVLTAGGAALADESEHYQVRELDVGGDKRIGTRFTLLTPKHTGDKKVPLLVLLHGLGETGDQKVGVRAWLDRYGLATAYDRLRTPPIVPLYENSPYWTKERLAEVNDILDDKPLQGMAIACPYTPNASKSPLGRETAIERYANWLVDAVIPKAREEAKILPTARHTYLDGCSMGGPIGLEVFLKKPEHFCAWGSVQGAFGAHRVAHYAKRLREVIDNHGKRYIHLETSTTDTFREQNEAFSKALDKEKVKHDLIIPPGPHNQPFLRDSGTIEMVLWHDHLPR